MTAHDDMNAEPPTTEHAGRRGEPGEGYWAGLDVMVDESGAGADTAEALVETVRAALSGASEAAILAQGTAKSRERVRDSWKPVFAALSVLAERLKAAEARAVTATDALRKAREFVADEDWSENAALWQKQTLASIDAALVDHP